MTRLPCGAVPLDRQPTPWSASAALIATVLLFGCGSNPAQLFPETGEVSAWSKIGQTRTFEAANLWQYVNGDADRYVRAGLQRTLTTDYRYQNRIDAVADIHILAAPEGARTIFESESPAGSQPIQLGDAARLYGASLTFRKGRYFVRLVAYESTPEVAKALVELARAIEGKLK